MTDHAHSASAAESAPALVLTRVLDAPREAVFTAWTDPAQLARWLGPAGIRAEIMQLDATTGGAYRIAMHDTPGGTLVVGGVYREIVRPERLVFTWAWEEDALSHRSGHETLVTVSLRALGNRTELTLRHERFNSTDSRDSHGHGWNGSFDRLATILASG